jgi:hypothetical protein
VLSLFRVFVMRPFPGELSTRRTTALEMRAMRCRSAAICVLALVCGCTSYYRVDLPKTSSFEGFDWDGTIRLRCTTPYWLTPSRIDRVELPSRDGRSVLIVCEDQQPKAYLEAQPIRSVPSLHPQLSISPRVCPSPRPQSCPSPAPRPSSLAPPPTFPPASGPTPARSVSSSCTR